MKATRFTFGVTPLLNLPQPLHQQPAVIVPRGKPRRVDKTTRLIAKPESGVGCRPGRLRATGGSDIGRVSAVSQTAPLPGSSHLKVEALGAAGFDGCPPDGWEDYEEPDRLPRLFTGEKIEQGFYLLLAASLVFALGAFLFSR